MILNDKSVCIVGLGLIGGSIAIALKDLQPHNLFAIDNDTKVLKLAEENNIIDKGSTSAKDFLSQSDLVIIALYPENIISFLKENISYFKKNALIIDVGGLKERIVTESQSFLREDLEFLGTHPMAGKEEKGFKNADKKIFYNSNFIITPTEKNTVESVQQIKEIAEAMGCKKVIALSPKEHDELITYTSHLPHIAAVALMNCNNYGNISGFVGGGFKDTTRIAAINSELWCELLLSNKKNVIDVIENLENQIEIIKNAVNSEDAKNLKQIFIKANNLRREL